MDNRYKAKIGISIGDTNGIGPEIIVKTLSDQRILNFCTPVIYGSAAVINKVRKALSAEHFHLPASDFCAGAYTEENQPDQLLGRRHCRRTGHAEAGIRQGLA
jgi:4-hydroxy-L-threonine phosphate dehydrogenase PdxA